MADSPPTQVTRTSTGAPADPPGVSAVIWPLLTTVTVVAATPPTVTEHGATKLVPSMVISWPPAVGPEDGLTLVTVGAPTKVYSSAVTTSDSPPGVVTRTSTVVPAVPAGAIAAIWPSLVTVKPAAGVPPKLTAVAPVNPLPLICTALPLVVGPWLGTRPLTAGGPV